jgi:hypothetical protein
LSVVQAELPRYHRFEQQRSALELRAGESLAVLLRVIPSAPAVQMIAQEVLTLEPSRGASRAPRVAADRASAQWQSNRRRIIRAPGDSDSLVTVLPSAPGLPWYPGRRRYVPAPSRQDSAVMTPPPTRRFVPPPPPSEPDSTGATPPATRHRYTVTRWDLSLVHVARVMYDDASLWPKIWLANLDQVKDPDVIRPGQRLRVPDKAPLTAAERAAGKRYMADHRP